MFLFFRVTHSLRSEGTAAAGPQARAHAAAPAVRIRECVFAGACGAGGFALKICGHRAMPGGVGLRHSIWRGWASLPSSPAAAGCNPRAGLGCGTALAPAGAARRSSGTAGPLLPPTPAIPAPVAVV